MENFIFLAIALIAVFVLINKIKSPKKASQTHKKKSLGREYEAIDYLMTINERRFFVGLNKVLHEDFYIFSKVRIADLVKAKSGAGWQTRFNKISRKHVDFVVADKSQFYKTVAIIEVDDKSHESRVDRDKLVDKAFKDAKIPLVRVKAKSSYSEQYISEQLSSKVYHDAVS